MEEGSLLVNYNRPSMDTSQPGFLVRALSVFTTAGGQDTVTSLKLDEWASDEL